MGKKVSGWLSTLKKAFKISPKNLSEKEGIFQKENAKKRQHSVKLARYGPRLKQERAAIIIQSYFRRYLARRAFRALRALVRLQAIVRGNKVRKQVQMTMQFMEALQRVQSRACSRTSVSIQNKLADQQRRTKRGGEEEHMKKSPMKKLETECWDMRNLITDKPRGKSMRKHDYYEMKRETPITSPFAYDEQPLHSDEDDIGDAQFYVHKGEESQWGLNRRLKWQSYDSPLSMTGETSDAIGGDLHDIYNKNVERDWTILRSERTNSFDRYGRDVIGSSPCRAHCGPLGVDVVPSYMAPTQSARAKVRVHDLVKQRSPIRSPWNSSTKTGLGAGPGYDSWRSPRGTTTYESPRSPNPKYKGYHI